MVRTFFETDAASDTKQMMNFLYQSMLKLDLLDPECEDDDLFKAHHAMSEAHTHIANYRRKQSNHLHG